MKHNKIFQLSTCLLLLHLLAYSHANNCKLKLKPASWASSCHSTSQQQNTTKSTPTEDMPLLLAPGNSLFY